VEVEKKKLVRKLQAQLAEQEVEKKKNNDGTTFVVEAGKEFKLLSTNKLGERITASPAISGAELIYRTDSHLYCIGQGK
jgi:hypothetical protein